MKFPEANSDKDAGKFSALFLLALFVKVIISKQEYNMEIRAVNIDRTLSATAYKYFGLSDLRDIIQPYCMVEGGLKSNFEKQYFIV